MKYYTLPLALALLAAPFAISTASSEESFHMSSVTSFSSYRTPDTTSSSQASFYYNDGNGEPTAFDMTSEKGRMTVSIRQHGALVWSRTFETKSSLFSVSRQSEDGRTWFLITAGDQTFRVEPDARGEWTARMAEGETK